MEITLTTPALLFPAISLLLLAYTNRFLVIAQLTRGLHSKYINDKNNPIFSRQIENLRKRIYLIRNMQAFGVSSLFFCVFCMLVLFAGQIFVGKILFGISLVLLMTSLGISIWEIQISVHALNIQLSDFTAREEVTDLPV
ncbi:MAG: DUF2721 domain-containing protein [Leptospiraceae bacterium]|nr:DUF2721 domain-containing protein [Leptospiraceae bacterium]